MAFDLLSNFWLGQDMKVLRVGMTTAWGLRIFCLGFVDTFIPLWSPWTPENGIKLTALVDFSVNLPLT